MKAFKIILTIFVTILVAVLIVGVVLKLTGKLPDFPKKDPDINDGGDNTDNEPKEVTINYYVDGNCVSSYGGIEVGSTFENRENDPTKDLAIFSYWINESTGETFDFSAPIEAVETINLRAVWTDAFTVIVLDFKGNERIRYNQQWQESLNVSGRVAPDTLEGYNFVEWRYQDTETAIDESTPVNESKYIYVVPYYEAIN